jgi:nucleoid-associated protein YgaU
MNKEAKIGLTIILVLLIIFVAVLAKRLYNSRTAEQVAAAADKEQEESGASANTEKKTSNNVDKAKTAIASGSQPTVVSAAAFSGKPPQGTANDLDPWSTASNSKRTKISDRSASDLKSPPSYMPEPPKPDAENRYDRYNKVDRSTSSYRLQQYAESASPDTADTKPRYNSLRDGPDRYSSADTSLIVRQADNSHAAGQNNRAAQPDSDNRYRSPASDRYTSIASTAGDYRNGPRSNHATTSVQAGRTYTVVDGDSLFDIARSELGKATRWVEIYDLNVDVLGKDIDCLAPGAQIILPEENTQKADPFAHRSSMEYRK